MRKCNEHIMDAIETCRTLTIIADEGERDATDDSCAVFYGVIRDCAYRIRHRAEQEREAHIKSGIWDGNGDS